MGNGRLHREALDRALRRFAVPPGRRVRLADHDPGDTADLEDQAAAEQALRANVDALSELQAMLYAQDAYALLLVLQGMDAAGKDGVVKHVLSGINPAGCVVTSFKAPSDEDLDHDYLWRAARALPGRGMMGIFNRSYYEEVLVVRVHPELLDRERVPADARRGLWERRFEEMNGFERYLDANGIRVVKVFLHLSKAEQRRRFLARIDEPEKNWKFNEGDVRERARWDDYVRAYEACLSATSTPRAPWYVVPADHKWFARLAVSEIVVRTLRTMELRYPAVDAARRRELGRARRILERDR
jgi:PPK2 family polyphosphate:nucleotide phosphotransferase